MKTKGMRDIPTMYGLAKRSKPNSRDEAITELARLEHEKARLERELALWQDNQKRTQQRLQAILGRLALLQAFVDGRPSEAASPDKQAHDAQEEAGANEQWTTIQLEY
jgi:ubiquitin